jgi:hypothetical protein
MTIPNGRYAARAIEAVLGESKNGKALLEIVWEITEGPEEGATVSSMNYFTGAAKPITIELMKHLGWSEGAELEAIRGTCTISIFEEEYNGELRQKVRAYVPRAGVQTPENKRKSPAAAKAFLERLTGGGGEAFETEDLPPEAHAAARKDAPKDGDDLPF